MTGRALLAAALISTATLSAACTHSEPQPRPSRGLGSDPIAGPAVGIAATIDPQGQQPLAFHDIPVTGDHADVYLEVNNGGMRAQPTPIGLLNGQLVPSQVLESQGQKMHVRLALPDPENRSGDLRLLLRFPQPSADAAADPLTYVQTGRIGGPAPASANERCLPPAPDRPGTTPLHGVSLTDPGTDPGSLLSQTSSPRLVATTSSGEAPLKGYTVLLTSRADGTVAAARCARVDLAPSRELVQTLDTAPGTEYQLVFLSANENLPQGQVALPSIVAMVPSQRVRRTG